MRKAAPFLTLAIVALLAVAPVGMLGVWSLARGWYWPAILPREWSWRAWAYVMSPASGVASALGLSLGIAIVVMVVSVIVALPAARALAYHDFRGKQSFLFLILLPVLSPPLASAMGVHSLFLRYGLTDSVTAVILVHLIPAVPYATLVLMTSFLRFDREFESQARTLGASTRAVWLNVTLPAILPGLVTAASFTFLISWSQYLLTLLIGGGRVQTLPLELVAFQRGGDEAVASALSLVFLTPALIAFLMASRKMGEESA